MSVVVDTLRVNGNSFGRSNGENFGAGSVYSSFKLFARFFVCRPQFWDFSKKYLKISGTFKYLVHKQRKNKIGNGVESMPRLKIKFNKV